MTTDNQLEHLTNDEIKALKTLAKDQVTLTRVAESDKSWSYVMTTVRRTALWIVSIITAAVFLWDKLKAFVGHAAKP